MLRGILTDRTFRDQLGKAIKPNAHYMTTHDEALNPLEVVMDGHIIKMGSIAWATWDHSSRKQTAEAAKNN